jgi:hypothetical protein
VPQFLLLDEMQRRLAALTLRGILFDLERHVTAIVGKGMRPMPLHLIALDHCRPLSVELLSVHRCFGTHLEWSNRILLQVAIQR